ncbi:hypothetical protein A9Q83_11785 [Alphaproteobacteria bacterium 46_93_T64]|nr:hypothetical protein A9Q83_11785 [Alphaproteobacteria bacterium 46_93_T64]
MLQSIIEFTGLTSFELLITTGAVFLAGLVRGFAGFALSAILMSSVVFILPPVELIPLCFVLEAAASLFMLRGGMKSADMSVVWVLAIGSAIGVPIGLYATVSISPEISKLVALIIIMTLTFAQLFNFAPRALGTKAGLYASGLIAGIVTGLASVGGMVVALYVLSSKAHPETMRSSLVMFLFLGMFTSLIYMLLYGVLDYQAMQRGMVFTPIVLTGVYSGSRLFRLSFVKYYKQFCLLLLITLSFVGMLKMI